MIGPTIHLSDLAHTTTTTTTASTSGTALTPTSIYIRGPAAPADGLHPSNTIVLVPGHPLDTPTFAAPHDGHGMPVLEYALVAIVVWTLLARGAAICWTVVRAWLATLNRVASER